MNRREFFELTGCFGLAAAGIPSLAKAQISPSYSGPLFLSIHCGGGWDPTSFSDPKGREAEDQPNPMNYYLSEAIKRPTIGSGAESSPIRWAPMGMNDAFFERFWSKLLVVNGVDTSTNNHMSGTRFVNSGVLDEGHPCLSSMVAAVHGSTLPLGFITNGGYDVTRGVVSRTRVGNLDALRQISYPTRINDNSKYMHDQTFDAVKRYQQERLQRKLDSVRLPRLKRTLEKYMSVHSSENELSQLESYLPELNSFQTGLGRQGAVALAGYRAGVTVSANLTTGGFDTHGNHDQNQANALDRLSTGVAEIWDQVEAAGLEEKVIIMVSSDFGRTPGYNAGNGKDHWPITSMLLLGAGIRGNRVIGQTTHGHRTIPVNPETFEPDDTGIILTPAHVHTALRSHLQLNENSVVRDFPLATELLPILQG